MPLVIRSFFFSGRFPVDSTGSVKADSVMLLCPRVVRIRTVNASAHVPARGVIKEMTTFPSAAPEAGPEITKSVVNSAIEADVRSPITAVPQIGSISKAPPSRSPKKPDFGRCYPHPRYPVIVVVSIGPVPRRPEVSISRAGGLVVNRDNGRRDCNRDVCGGEEGRKPQNTNEEHKVHSFRNELQHKMTAILSGPYVLQEAKKAE